VQPSPPPRVVSGEAESIDPVSIGRVSAALVESTSSVSCTGASGGGDDVSVIVESACGDVVSAATSGALAPTSALDASVSLRFASSTPTAQPQVKSTTQINVRDVRTHASELHACLARNGAHVDGRNVAVKIFQRTSNTRSPQ
jgi:hypothetical protein